MKTLEEIKEIFADGIARLEDDDAAFVVSDKRYRQETHHRALWNGGFPCVAATKEAALLRVMDSVKVFDLQELEVQGVKSNGNTMEVFFVSNGDMLVSVCVESTVFFRQ